MHVMQKKNYISQPKQEHDKNFLCERPDWSTSFIEYLSYSKNQKEQSTRKKENSPRRAASEATKRKE